MMERKISTRIATVLNNGQISVLFGWGKRSNQNGCAYVSASGVLLRARLGNAKCGTRDTWENPNLIPADIRAAVLACVNLTKS